MAWPQKYVKYFIENNGFVGEKSWLAVSVFTLVSATPANSSGGLWGCFHATGATVLVMALSIKPSAGPPSPPAVKGDGEQRWPHAPPSVFSFISSLLLHHIYCFRCFQRICWICVDRQRQNCVGFSRNNGISATISLKNVVVLWTVYHEWRVR